MAYFKATIEILLDVDSETDACDAISETLREQLRTFTPDSCIIDWRYSDHETYPVMHDGSGFEYADPAMMLEAQEPAPVPESRESSNASVEPPQALEMASHG